MFEYLFIDCVRVLQSRNSGGHVWLTDIGANKISIVDLNFMLFNRQNIVHSTIVFKPKTKIHLDILYFIRKF